MIERSEFNDDSTALAYARARGYCSYSSIKMIRDCESPSYSSEVWFEFGKELHSRLLENKVIKKLSDEEEAMLKIMLAKLRNHSIVKKLLARSRNEQQFHHFIYGVSILGYIDILNSDSVADLKTTQCKTRKAFVASMDFLQAAIYIKAARVRDFFWIGISKQEPYEIWVFAASEFPLRLALAQLSMRRLLMYIKSKWGCNHRDTLKPIKNSPDKNICIKCGKEFKIIKR